MLRFSNCLVAIGLLIGGCANAEPFPAVIDDEVKITLQRTACFGSCPDYTVTIDGKGNVSFVTRGANVPGDAQVHREYSADDGVLVSGTHTDRIDPQVVRDLVAQFREADFFNLKDEYVAGWTDHSTYVLTIDTGAGTKTVVDYIGREAGMPASVTKLEEAVDRAAGTARWVDGADGLVAWLEGQGYDFTSREAGAILIEGALGDASEGTLIGMIERGANLEMKGPDRGNRSTSPLGKALLLAATNQGRSELFGYLADRGWAERIEKATLEREFAQGAAGCSAALVRAFTARGLSIDTPGEEGETALAALAGSYSCKSDEAARVETARALLDAGADPNKRDSDGETAVFNVESPPLLDLLYARGAKADIADKDGNSPVFSSWTDAIVQRHLQQGARPVGKYYDGRTLREQMKYRPMPQAKQWLEEHPMAERR